MLAADKDKLIASAKQTALLLRHKELDYYIERYSNLATQSSILAGFAFDGLVELEIHQNGHPKWVEPIFYTAGSCTMAFALFTLCVSSFATVYGHRLALQGPTGSVERAVAVMMKHRTSIFVSFALAMVCLIIAATAMAWIKMGDAAAGVTGVFGVLLLSLVYKHQEMKFSFRIDPEQMVQGDVRLHVGVADVDIATLEAGFGGGGSYGGEGMDPQASAVAAAAFPQHVQHRSMPMGRSLDGGEGVGIGPIASSNRREPLLAPGRE
jgi:MFS family permease